jgi:signal transduction histidine kinase
VGLISILQNFYNKLTFSVVIHLTIVNDQLSKVIWSLMATWSAEPAEYRDDEFERRVDAGAVDAVARPVIHPEIRQTRSPRPFQPAPNPPTRLQDCVEREARRLAQLLHDDAGQLLAAAHIKIDLMARKMAAPEATCLAEVKSILEEVEAQLRHLSHELRPTRLEDLGLIPAIEFLAGGVSKRTGMTITVEGSTEGRLPPAVEIALYRTVQEALTNISKHARAKHVRIRLQRDHRIQCSIQDDGVGFNASEAFTRKNYGLGLIGIRERIDDLGGSFLITSNQGKGVTLLVAIPLLNTSSGKSNRETIS